MVLSRERKEACHRLYRHGALQSFGPGDVVARGFADIGFEEFFVLHDGSLLSLTSGRRSELPLTERHAFFLIPSTDDTVAEIERLGGSITAIERHSDGLQWSVHLTSNDGQSKEVEAFSFDEGLMKALGFMVGIDPFQGETSRLRIG